MNKSKKLSNKKNVSSKDFQTVARALRDYDKHPEVNYKKIHPEGWR